MKIINFIRKNLNDPFSVSMAKISMQIDYRSGSLCGEIHSRSHDSEKSAASVRREAASIGLACKRRKHYSHSSDKIRPEIPLCPFSRKPVVILQRHQWVQEFELSVMRWAMIHQTLENIAGFVYMGKTRVNWICSKNWPLVAARPLVSTRRNV